MKPVVKEITQAQRKMAARGLKPAAPSEPGIEGKNIERWTAKSLLQILNATYTQTKEGKKAAALVLGAAGIGKSEIVQNFARMVAKGEGRQFIPIDDLKNEDREKVFEDPSKWYVFLDLRAGQLNPEQAQGIPDVEYGKRKGFLRFLPPDWAALISDERFSGMVFLDELNRGQESVINSLFQFVLDRIVSGRRVGSGCTIIAAANLGTGGEFSGTTTLDSALMSRFSVGVLVADAEEWLDWAAQNNIDKNIIAFIKSNPELNFYARGKEIADHNIPINPRNITFADRNLKFVEQAYEQAFNEAAKAGINEPSADDIKKFLPLIPGSKELGQPTASMTGHIYNDIRVAIGSRLGTEWATSFIQFLETIDAFDWADILEKTKSKVWVQKGGKKGKEELNTSQIWALTNFILDNIVSEYNAAADKDDVKNKQRVIQELATILGGLPSDEQVAFLIKALNNSIGKGRVDLPKGMPLNAAKEQAAKNFVELLVGVAKILKVSDPGVFKKIQDFLNELERYKSGALESAKQIYEKITLGKHKPTPAQLKALEGSKCHQRYHGIAEEKNTGVKFKSFFAEKPEDLSRRKNITQLAEYVIDKVEETFDMHYSNVKTEKSKHSIQDIAKFAFNLLDKVNAAHGDKEKITKAIKKSDTPDDMLIRLQVMSGAK